jgi:type II secretion system protein H
MFHTSHETPTARSADFSRLRPSFRGRARAANWPARFSRGFTLIELILVMAILTVAVSVTAPMLSQFFRGRTLDSEARRLLALTRSGQSRAASEGVPIDLWVDSQQGVFGLEAEPSYEDSDGKAVSYWVDTGLKLEASVQTVGSLTNNPSRGQSVSTASVAPIHLVRSTLPTIRFLPDGSISDTSPKTLRLTARDGSSLCLARARNGLNYEIRNTDQ